LYFTGRLNIDHNRLTGQMTEFVSPVLKYVDASDNHLNGTIPSSFFYLPGLSNLYLMNNAFSSIIPSTFGESTMLEALWLNGNRLTGSIPAVPSPGGWPKLSK
jgi:Leucine-rich repeat (LRR) protein